jgi:hypothetical protein
VIYVTDSVNAGNVLQVSVRMDYRSRCTRHPEANARQTTRYRRPDGSRNLPLRKKRAPLRAPGRTSASLLRRAHRGRQDFPAAPYRGFHVHIRSTWTRLRRTHSARLPPPRPQCLRRSISTQISTATSGRRTGKAKSRGEAASRRKATRAWVVLEPTTQPLPRSDQHHRLDPESYQQGVHD